MDQIPATTSRRLAGEEINVARSDIPKIILLSGVFVASLVTANLIASKLIVIAGITVSAGTLVLPVTFLMTDLLTELYGHQVARTTVAVGLGLQVYVLFLVWLGGIMPAAPQFDVSQAYNQLFGLTPRMIVASIVAYSCSQFIDVQIYHQLKIRTRGRHLWLRNNCSTMISQGVDTAIFVVIFLGGMLPAMELLKTFYAIYVVKLVMALGDTPLIYLGKYVLEARPLLLSADSSLS